MAEEHEDEPTWWPRPDLTPCACPDPGRACTCDDDGDTAEPREWVHADKPETMTAPTGAAAGRAGEIRG